MFNLQLLISLAKLALVRLFVVLELLRHYHRPQRKTNTLYVAMFIRDKHLCGKDQGSGFRFILMRYVCHNI